MTPRCSNIECLKDHVTLVDYPAYPGSRVFVKLCEPCAKERRHVWLKQNRPAIFRAKMA